ncbi:MAG TPA: hypothetical protein VF742_11635, partial [Terracidiphilus sp.]
MKRAQQSRRSFSGGDSPAKFLSETLQIITAFCATLGINSETAAWLRRGAGPFCLNVPVPTPSIEIWAYFKKLGEREVILGVHLGDHDADKPQIRAGASK